MLKVSIFGSCVTRDAFEFDKNNFILDEYFARSSIASFSGQPKTIPEIISGIDSNFQQKMVKRDMEKTFLEYCNSNKYDLIVFDFIDERFRLYKNNDIVCTYSSEFAKGCKKSMYKIYSSQIVQNYTTDKDSIYYKLWKNGLEKVKNKIKLNEAKIVLNKVYWTNILSNGEKLEQYSDEIIEKNNKFLDLLYNDFSSAFKNIYTIEYPKELLKANKNHKWGVEAFHYIDELYIYLINKLKELKNND